MKNALIAAIVSAVIAGSSAFAAGTVTADGQNARSTDVLTHCLVLEAKGNHQGAINCAKFVRTMLPQSTETTDGN